MSLRKWAAALISAPEARGQKSVKPDNPAAPASATKATPGTHPIDGMIRLERQSIKRATIASLGVNCTLILSICRSSARAVDKVGIESDRGSVTRSSAAGIPVFGLIQSVLYG